MSDVEKYVPKATKNPKEGDVNIKLKWGKIITVAQRDFKRIKKFFKVDSIVEPIEDKLVVKCYIYESSLPATRNLISGYEPNQFKSIEVDGNLLDSTSYTFTTDGNHIIKYELYQEGIIGNQAPVLFGNIDIIELTVPEGVTEIKPNTFSGVLTTSLTTNVTLPSTLTKLGSGVFGGVHHCNFYIKATTPPVIEGYLSADDTINYYVPAESLEAYKQADGWSSIASYIQPIPE